MLEVARTKSFIWEATKKDIKKHAMKYAHDKDIAV